MIKKKIPSFITSFRIVGSLVLFFMVPFELPFYILYTFCGISDVLDGLLARMWKVESDSGAALDSIADLFFYTVFMIHLLPVLHSELPLWGWCYLFVVLFVRMISYLTVAIKYHRFAAVHTYANKLTGLALFSVPYMRFALNMSQIALIVCTIALLASLEELTIHLISEEYRPELKSFLMIVKSKTGASTPKSV